MSPETLAVVMSCPIERAQKWAAHLDEAMSRFDINTVKRQAAFLAQVGHESGRLRYSAEIWNPAQCPWQGRYEGRADLGNVLEGDGARFKGRGLIQITGRANYAQCASALNLPLLDQPELLEEPGNASLSAAWFWDSRKLNSLADIGDFERITKRINGGLNGFGDRLALWQKAQEVFA